MRNLVCLWFLPYLLCAQDWPMYLGDLKHTSNAGNQAQISPSNAANLQPLWKTTTGATISSGVTVMNGTAYVGDWFGWLYSMDAATGTVNWRANLGVAPSPPDPTCMGGIGIGAQAVVSGNSVYAGGGDSAVYALDRNTGATQWRVPLADPVSGSYLWSSLMLANHSLYVGIASLGDCPLVRGGLARISLDDPTHPLIRYFVPDGALGAGVWGTPALDTQANLIYVTTGNADSQDQQQPVWGSALLALDASTLEVRAHFFLTIESFDVDEDFGSSPLLFETADGQQYVAASGKNGVMYVLHRPDLTLAWSYKLAIDCPDPEYGCGSLSTPAFADGLIYAGAGSSDTGSKGTVYAIDPQTRSARWVYAAPDVVLAPVTVSPGLVYVPTLSGLVILDSTTGRQLFADSAGTYLSQVAESGGVLYTTSAEGNVTAWTVPGSAASLVASPGALHFGYTQSGEAPAVQSATVYSSAASMQVSVRSDSSWLSADLASAAAPAVVNVHVDASGMTPGSYSASLIVTPVGGASPISIPVSLLVNPPLPAIDASAVVNAANFAQTPLAPGSLFTVFANGLAGATRSAETIPLPLRLAGISATINGLPAPLLFAGPSQINAQVPFETQPGIATLILASNGVSSAPVQIQIAPTGPGIFLQSDGKQAAAVNQDGAVNTPTVPAPAGSVISIYFTGQGLLDQNVSTGGAAFALLMCTTLADTTATIGDQTAVVTYSGLAPHFVGLAQANVQVPDLPPGDYPLQLTAGGIMSNAGIISVGAAAENRDVSRTPSLVAAK